MEISISTGLYYKKNHIEILDIIAATGCKNIELFLNQAFIDVDISEIEKEIKKRDLKVTSIHLPLTFIAYDRGETEEYWIKKGIEYANVLDTNILVSHFFYKKDDKTHNDDSHFNNMVTFSKSSKKFICTENLPVMELKTKHQNPEELIKFLSENNCYMTYDTTHTATYNKSIIDEYNLFKNHIRNIHLSDFSNGNEHKVLGHGVLPIKEFIQTLKDDNYLYPITLEYDFENPTRNKVTSDEEAIRFLKDSISLIEEVISS
ncbi:MAG: sugar phosphate isomerase/epimerase [Spirochaetaceae bacterium]